ncbi:two-component regulator propeller domain-containing protein [Emticicia sp. C21]|uniref:ligand-binding sensor domain-containing protein n=1 Tax=Emticicia sp. C21 TaxID=2302915 RepID=UPI000E354605|nr:sensor histidine kinase [Emticicia sp. C21]RFS17171.1 hypothetical protein D0T08_05130 [Emticicia sp. C21]
MAGKITKYLLKKSLFVLLLWLGFCHLLIGQEKLNYEFSFLKEEDGLSNNHIVSMLRDRDGFLWIATIDGLNRYDGSHFTVFKADYKGSTTLANNAVHGLCEDKDGNIWATTDDGICYYNKKTNKFQSYKELNGQKFARCYFIICDKKGDIWFAGDMGLYHLAKKTQKITSLFRNSGPVNSISDDDIYSIKEYPQENMIWIATVRGVNYIDINTKKFYNSTNNPAKFSFLNTNVINTLTINNNHLIFADEIRLKIVVVNLLNKKVVAEYNWPGKKSLKVNHIFVDKDHNYWISFQDHDLFFIDSKTKEIKEVDYNPARKREFTNVQFKDLYHNSDGMLLFGTSQGLAYLEPDDLLYKIYNLNDIVDNKEPAESFSAFAESADKTWWLGNWTRKLIHFNPHANTHETFQLPPEYSNNHKYIHTICETKETVYAATHGGIFWLNKKTKQLAKLKVPAKIVADSVFVMTMVLNKDVLWIRTSTTMVFAYHISNQKWEEFFLLSYLPKNFYTTRMFLEFDKHGDLWANLYPRGFAKLSKREHKFIKREAALKEDFEKWLFQFRADSANHFWYPTMGYGLVKYDMEKGTIQNWRESDGLMFDHCMAVCPDKFGNIWVGSFHKFSIFNPEKNYFQNFRIPYNEETNQYRSYMFPLSNQHILALQKNVLIEFIPENISINTSSNNTLLINSVQLADTTLLLSNQLKSINLGVDDNNFSISYAVLSPAQEQYRYYYQLEGFDDTWVEAGSKTVANYTRIPGGNYTFRVKAVAGNVEIMSSDFPVHIATHFYKTYWFLATVLLLIAAIVYFVYRYRVKQSNEVHRLQAQTSRLEKDKTEIQYQNLINHLNPHFLFNSLTSLNSLILTEPKQASKFLQKLSLIYRYILQNKEKESVTLEHEINFVKNYIDLQNSRFEDGLVINMDIPKEYLSDGIVPVTLQNLFENAIKHNTIEDEKPLVISVYVEDECLIVENNIQKKAYVETSNKQGLESLKKLYYYLTSEPVEIIETDKVFKVKVPLL